MPLPPDIADLRAAANKQMVLADRRGELTVAPGDQTAAGEAARFASTRLRDPRALEEPEERSSAPPSELVIMPQDPASSSLNPTGPFADGSLTNAGHYNFSGALGSAGSFLADSHSKAEKHPRSITPPGAATSSSLDLEVLPVATHRRPRDEAPYAAVPAC